MSELSSDILRLLHKLAESPILLVACDFDGTLSEIAPTPGTARPHEGGLAHLRALGAMRRTYGAVISGRGLVDLESKVGSPQGLTMIGGHGAESMGGASGGMISPELAAVLAVLRDIAARYTGALVEVKRTSAAIHYRLVSPSRHDELIREVECEAERLRVAQVRPGLLVLELCLVAADKGTALRGLLQRTAGTACLYIGDDATDEDAFAALRANDLGIKVGDGLSRAAARVSDVEEAALVLAELRSLRAAHLEATLPTPIDHLGHLSDQRTTALVDTSGAVCWMCAPRIDSRALFGALLGGDDAGVFRIAPVGGGVLARRRYEPDTFLLETMYDSLAVTDYLDCSGGRAFQRAGRSDLIRSVRGSGEVAVEFSPRIDFGRTPTRLRLVQDGIVVEGSIDPVMLFAPGVTWRIVDKGPHQSAFATHKLSDDVMVFELRVGDVGLRSARAPESARRDATRRHWTAWAATLAVPPMETRVQELVRRSALVIRSLCYGPTGAICAASTTSLPEQFGGVRNWDYRFCWVRDAAMSACALVRLGSTGHAMKLLDWLLGVLDELPGPEFLRPIYTVSGAALGEEGELPELSGYDMSRPVRVGNGAGHQVQLDVFGVVADLIHGLAAAGAPLTPDHLRLLDAMSIAVAKRWDEPDHGIWEIRGPLRHHVHSKTLCWSTIDRAVRVRELLGDRARPADLELRDAIRNDVLERGYSSERGAFVAAYGERGLDAACLLTGLTGLVAGDDPRFVSTVRAVRDELLDGRTVMRYKEDDGLPGLEGGFHLCTGWLIEAMWMAGMRSEATELFRSYVSQVGPLGLYAEEVEVRSGMAMGNYPQAYSHLALIQAACRLASG